DSTSSVAGRSVACLGTSTTCTVTLDAAKNVTASFSRSTFPLTVSLTGTGGGTVTSGDGSVSCAPTCSATYNLNTSVTLTATPDASSTFAGWSGACAGTTGNVCTITMSQARSV